MQRFFVSSKDRQGDKLILDDLKIIHHARDVLRLKAGEILTVIDQKGTLFECRIEELSERAVLKIIKEIPSGNEDKIRISIACAIPKRNKMDDIVDKLTQLGVEEIIPFFSERVVVMMDKKKRRLRWERWRKIAESASQQSQRTRIPIIEEPCDFKQVLKKADDFKLKLIAAVPAEKKDSLKRRLDHSGRESLMLLIGPEGDFTPGEIELAKKNGFLPVSLGDTVLRVETAVIAAVSFLRLYEKS